MLSQLSNSQCARLDSRLTVTWTVVRASGINIGHVDDKAGVPLGTHRLDGERLCLSPSRWLPAPAAMRALRPARSPNVNRSEICDVLPDRSRFWVRSLNDRTKTSEILRTKHKRRHCSIQGLSALAV